MADYRPVQVQLNGRKVWMPLYRALVQRKDANDSVCHGECGYKNAYGRPRHGTCEYGPTMGEQK